MYLGMGTLSTLNWIFHRKMRREEETPICPWKDRQVKSALLLNPGTHHHSLIHLAMRLCYLATPPSRGHKAVPHFAEVQPLPKKTFFAGLMSNLAWIRKRHASPVPVKGWEPMESAQKKFFWGILLHSQLPPSHLSMAKTDSWGENWMFGRPAPPSWRVWANKAQILLLSIRSGH